MAVENKRETILETAVAVMSRKGKNATISEIAAKAGVTDSVLYHYFKNKDDLLFYAAGEHLKQGIEILNSHLSGIREPVSRLSKFIWFQLYFHDSSPQYAYFTIFECRSKKDFFHHPAYDYFRQWSRILRQILEDGQKTGDFSPDLDVFVIRDMILGLLDMENIQVFTRHHEGPAQDDLDDILDLLHPVLSPAPEPQTDKRGRIMAAAEAFFARNGYDKASIARIARAAQVAEGSIYDYFKNKEDLLHSIFQGGFQRRRDGLDGLFDIRRPSDKLRRFILYFFGMYLDSPSFGGVFVLNGVFSQRFYRSGAYGTFGSCLEGLDAILEEGLSSGEFRPGINGRILKNMLMGVFSHMVLRWVFVDSFGAADKAAEIHTVVHLLTRMVAVSPGTLPR